MGQYHRIVNLDKKEGLDAHTLGAGLKACEQAFSSMGTSAALIMLIAASCKGGARGGGDFRAEDPDGVIGRWAGDRIAMVGDYAEADDVPGVDATKLYGDDEGEDGITDISDIVAAQLEREAGGIFTGTGWRRLICQLDQVAQWAHPETGERQPGGERFVGVVIGASPSTRVITVDWKLPEGSVTKTYQVNGEVPFFPI